MELTTGIITTISGTAVTTSLTFNVTKDDHLGIFECRAENGVLQNPLSTTKFIEVHCKFISGIKFWITKLPLE